MKVPPHQAWGASFPQASPYSMLDLAPTTPSAMDPMLQLGEASMPVDGRMGFDNQRKGRKPQSTNKPLAPAKSVATASRAFFKGLKRAVSEASNLALTANLTRNSPGSQTCQVGIAVLAVGHGLTDNKNGRVSKDEEQRAARRKPQAFLLQDGQIAPGVMTKIFRAAIEGTREGSPPAEITTWNNVMEMEKWYARREAERSNMPHPGSMPQRLDGDPNMQHQPAHTEWPRHPGQIAPPHPHAMIGWYPEDPRMKCPADITKWLREECAAGLDEEDISKLMHCLTHPDWGIKNKEFLFALSDEDLKMMMAPIREQGLKNFIIQKCRKFRPRDSYGLDVPVSKARKTNSGAKASDRN
jgi:hypothetical protein